jgi:hypothetical protein
MPSMGLHQLSFVVSAMPLEGVVVSGRGTTIRWGKHVVAGALSFHVAVVVGANEASVLCHLGESG